MDEIEDEFHGVDLGDGRLNRRVQTLASTLALHPERSFPAALGRGAELEACYRLLNNARVDPKAILSPHQDQTIKRIHAHDVVLLVHDTTACSMPGEGGRLPKLQSDAATPGFFCHLTLAVGADGRREPLGVVSLHTFTRDGTKQRTTSDKRRTDETRESKRWLQQSVLAEEAIGAGPRLIHVEDREGDIYDSLAERSKRGMHFIVRGQTWRNILVDGEVTNIAEFMRGLPRTAWREVELSRRAGPAVKRPKTAHTRRDRRVARLAIAAASIRVRRPTNHPVRVVESISLNAVHVIEEDPPEGEPPVEWLLLTTESIATAADVALIIDWYRARWTIEEYFKALKTGCSYEARQLETYEALLRALSIFAVIAWRLLWLRFVAHHTPTAPAGDFADADELAVLRKRKLIQDDANVADFLDAIAALGGHLKHNGPPGWQTLWRGWQRLRELADGWRLARSDQ